MYTRKSWITAIALGAMTILMADAARADDAKPTRPDQPPGSVRHAKKRVTRSPSAAGADTSAGQRPGRTDATRQPQGTRQVTQRDRDGLSGQAGSDQRAARRAGGDRDGRTDAGGDNDRHGNDRGHEAGRDDARDGRNFERDDGRHEDNDGGRPGDRDRHEFRGVRGPHGDYREFHHGPDSVRVYGKRPLRGSVFLHAPDRCDVVHFAGRRYFVRDDVYYIERPLMGGTRYVVVPPPIGVHVSYLPETAVAVQIGGFSFYYCDDTYYRVEYINDAPEYVVTDVPLGASIVELPEEYEPVAVRDVTYYRVGAAFYRPYFQENRVVYVHVEAPW
jgi:hypothetical protein